MSKILTKSKDMSTEYCATVVQIGEVKPIENSDFLGSVMIEGREIVVRKDSVKEGDVMIYVSNECQLNKDFLSVNNEFEDITLNANADEVLEQVAKMENDGVPVDTIQKYKQDHRGYFNKYGRVRMKKLRGVMSMGYLIKPETMNVWDPKFELDIEVGEDFDTVNGVLFVQAYVPPVKEHAQGTGPKDRNRHIKKFDRMIPGEFHFHYDTQQLNRSMGKFEPSTHVTISNKLHGCVSEDTLVETLEYGKLPIGKIVKEKIECLIKAFDTETNQDVFVPIDQYYTIPNDGEWYEIETEDGRTIKITGNNPIWLPKLQTYRRVDELIGNEYIQISD